MSFPRKILSSASKTQSLLGQVSSDREFFNLCFYFFATGAEHFLGNTFGNFWTGGLSSYGDKWHI